MQFRSGREAGTPGCDINVTTLAGHCAVVGPEWRELPEVLHQAALNAGCEVDSSRKQSTAVAPKASADAVNQNDEVGLIKKAIKALLKTNDADDFTVDGIPKVAAVNREAGFTATKADVLTAWEQVQAEAGGAE